MDREHVLFAPGYGLADLKANARATVSTSYPWFSKIVTATAAIRLVDEGRLDLKAPVRE